jgi:hypothetical protein
MYIKHRRIWYTHKQRRGDRLTIHTINTRRWFHIYVGKFYTLFRILSKTPRKSHTTMEIILHLALINL